MCGICGVLHFDGQTPSIEVLSSMTEVLQHRGPDGSGLHIQGPVGLGHRRLSVIDLSSSGTQPMTNEDGSIWLVYNGEIYNFKELRTQLQQKGHIFRSMTDTEVILHAYETWGVNCLEHFDGMFAFALFDANQQILWLARDRLGIKPLFYLLRQDRLLFASEIKSILCDPSVQREVNLNALHHYLSLNYTPAPYSLFSGINQLMPGHYMIVSADGRHQTKCYWDISYSHKSMATEAELGEELEARLSSAVQNRLISDVPIGAFLSGGVDSSAIVYWMSQHLGQPAQTFSVGFPERTYSELDYARTVASACHTNHHERVIEPDAVEILPKVVWHSEEPTADSSMIPLYHLAKMTRENVTVVLSGDGADEILAGYETYPANYAAGLYRLLPFPLRHHFVRPIVDHLPVSHNKVSLDFRLRRFVRGAELDEEAAHAYWRVIFDESAKNQLYLPEVSNQLQGVETTQLYRTMFAQSTADHPLDRMLYVDTRFYLPNDMLVKVDRMTMAHSLEARVPFLDHQLVEFCATLPPNLKLRHWRTKKYLLKATMHQRLPQANLWRKKQGFNVPKAHWIMTDMRDFVQDHLSPQQIEKMELFRTEQVSALLNEHFTKQRDNSHQIWSLLCLSLWWQQFIGAKPN
jgi:asparagine synthase (glutamine-hydrolysing)